jgi:hypothetical protein
MSGINQIAIERTYQVWAKLYEWLVPAYLLAMKASCAERLFGRWN